MKMVTMMVIIPLALCHALVGTRAFSIAPTSSTRQFHETVSPSVFGSMPTTVRTPNNNRGIQFNAAQFATSLWMAGSNSNEEDEYTKRILSEVAELTANFEEVSRTVKSNAETFTRKIASYESKLEETQKELDLSQKLVEERQQSIKDLENQIKELSQKEASTKEQITLEEESLKKEKEQANKMLQMKETEIKEKGVTIKDLERQIDECLKKQATAEKKEKEEIQQDEKIIATLQKERDDLKQRMEQLQGLLQSKEKDLKQTKENEMKKGQELARKNLASEKEIKDLKKDHKKETEELSLKIVALERIKDELTHDKEELETKMSNEKETAKEHEAWEKERALLLKQKTKLEQQVAKFEDEINVATISVRSELTQQLIDVRLAGAKERGEVLAKAESTARTLEEKLRDMEGTIGIYEGERSSLRKLTALGWRRFWNIILRRGKKQKT